LIDTDADLRDKVAQTLDRYIVMDDVTLQPLELGAVAAQGPRSHALMEEVLEAEMPPLDEFGHFLAPAARYPARVVRASSTGEDGYELWVGAADLVPLWDDLCRKAPAFDALPCGSEALESLRIEAGVPRYGADFGEDTLPLEAGLLNALSFTKGCYVGQEIVERARSRGHVNWKLVGLIVEAGAPPAPGEKLLDEGREVGEVTSSCVSPTLGKTIALAFVRREVSESGTRVALGSGAHALVAPLPFYRREGRPAGTPG
jgi:folate-binding protein YgfZ